jgi:hypothetical protein
MKLVMIESPYAGDIDKNVEYASRAMKDSISRGEAPLASHLLYTQEGILDDNTPKERRLGIKCGLEWSKHANFVAFYVDNGMSSGMISAKDYYDSIGKEYVFRTLDK